MVRFASRSAVVAIALLTSIAGAHAQSRDRASSLGTATILGTAVSYEPEPRPVRRVRVTCTGSGFAATAITDDRGRFVFAGLKAGRYTVTATKDAWVTSAYGAKRPSRPGSAIPLANGQTASITLAMIRGSVITGVLLDYNNQPAADTSVSALRYVVQDGSRRLSPVASATTDDRGVYRIYGLAPGDYFVGAAARAASLGSTSSELRLLDERRGTERTVALASTYFPGTPVATQAIAVTLGPAQERDGVDFALQLVPTARVEGSVTTTDGSPALAGTQVNLIASAQTTFPGTAFGALRSARVSTEGTFSFVDVAPGTYTVLARGGPPLTWASAEIAVDGENVTGLSLGLQPGMTLTGQLKFDAMRLKLPADLGSMRVALQPVQSQGAVTLAPSGARIDASGRFEITGILPGRYRLTASLPGLGRPGNWYLRSAVVNGQDTIDMPIEIRPNELIRDALVTLSDHPAQLTGTVQNAAGGAPNEFTVILFPADQALWLAQSRRIHGLRPSADGAFSFSVLPPGEYLLAAIDDVEPNEWFDPALLQRLVPTAMKVVLADGEQKVQDIRLGGGG
ncbi:MAG TPA: carboxypeptidase regulatory-like domain-containing protein [Vicinamibacterales bacterium]|nr:carboxypeptidase regulatory-like domain-containing protein [Vicinamibacterales bacterium]